MSQQEYNPQVAGAPFDTSDLETRERLLDGAIARSKEPSIEGVPAELLQRSEEGELYVRWIDTQREPDLREAVRQAVEKGRVIRIDDRVGPENRRRVEQHIARCSAEYHERLALEARNTLQALGG